MSGCQRDNREYPEGNVPGSYLGLNTIEKNQLLGFSIYLKEDYLKYYKA